MSPTRVVAVAFALIILAGGLLLTLPAAARDGQSHGFLTGLFTATSATCVTGLVLGDTWTLWSGFGQIVILCLIEIGGLGFMSVASTVIFLLKRKLGLRHRMVMAQALSVSDMASVVRLQKWAVLGSIAIQLTGALILTLRFLPDFGLEQAATWGIFHAVSAFCNAGFDIFGKIAPNASVITFNNDPVVCITIMALIVIGGLGFFVWYDILKNKFRIRRYKLHTKVVLITTFGLIAIPFLLMVFFERNSAELHANGTGEYLLSMLFQTITPRTAGFNSVDYGLLSNATIVLSIFLMIVGGSPSSTAGGMKTTTLAMWFAGMISVLRRRKTVESFHRRMGEDAMLQIVSVSAMYILMFFVSGMLICAFDPVSIKESFFEVASALGTVGLTLGITPTLSVPSLLVLIALMFFGRVGGITLLLAFHGQQGATPSKYPVEKINIG